MQPVVFSISFILAATNQYRSGKFLKQLVTHRQTHLQVTCINIVWSTAGHALIKIVPQNLNWFLKRWHSNNWDVYISKLRHTTFPAELFNNMSNMNMFHSNSWDIFALKVSFWLCCRYSSHVKPVVERVWSGWCWMVVVVPTAWPLQRREHDTGLALRTPSR